MGTDGKYGKVTTEKKVIPEDEPVFVLRGQDVLAPHIIRQYAELYLSVTGNVDGYTEIMRQSRKMDVWKYRKIPS